jgi:hypothetical protein
MSSAKNNLDFLTYTEKCIWLIGSGVNAEVIWQQSGFESMQNLAMVECVGLFEQCDYKININKENFKQCAEFLQHSPRESWNTRMLIKIAPELFDKKGMLQLEDALIEIDKWSKNRIFDEFMQIEKIEFSDEQILFIKKHCEDLRQILLCNLLKLCEIATADWLSFFDDQSVEFAVQVKEKMLLANGVLHDDMMRRTHYALIAEKNTAHRAILQFLMAEIKCGERVWANNELWKDLISRVS